MRRDRQVYRVIAFTSNGRVLVGTYEWRWLATLMAWMTELFGEYGFCRCDIQEDWE